MIGPKRILSSLRYTPRPTYAQRHVRPLSGLTSKDSEALEKWKEATVKTEHVAEDYICRSKLQDLYATLPLRKVEDVPKEGEPIAFGHHLVFFNGRSKEADLRLDQTENKFSPPYPFSRRMWAGGLFLTFPPVSRGNLIVGTEAKAVSEVQNIEFKGFDKGKPMIFVMQSVKYGEHPPAVVDDARGISNQVVTHVYLPEGYKPIRKVSAQVDGLPEPQYSYSWTPTPTTLFRFSALTFNSHLIHLDRDYAQKEEGYPERLVHGPLTALMMVEVAAAFIRGKSLTSFNYRALNPVIVNRQQTIHCTVSSLGDKEAVVIWAVDDDGVVGMIGKGDLVVNGEQL